MADNLTPRVQIVQDLEYISLNLYHRTQELEHTVSLNQYHQTIRIPRTP